MLACPKHNAAMLHDYGFLFVLHQIHYVVKLALCVNMCSLRLYT